VKTRFRQSFEKDLSTLSDLKLLGRIRQVIEQVEAARNFAEIPNLKRLSAAGKYYRIRIGDYRIGFTFEEQAVTFVRCLHRKEIYRWFP